MELSHPLSNSLALPETEQEMEEETGRRIHQSIRDHVSTLPAVDGLAPLFEKLRCYNGCFMPAPVLVSAMVAQQHFQAQSSDIILATFPKSGTTWIKALLFATVNRNTTNISDPCHPLATLTPHECIPFLELDLFSNDKIPNLDSLPSPRLVSTHVPFHLLPNSVLSSSCRIVYLCRNLKDVFVSLWFFTNKVKINDGVEPLSFESSFDWFSSGKSVFGPYWNHALGYWKASLERPDKVLFMKYEELMEDPISQLKRLADFVGFPFTSKEAEKGATEDIVRVCGFDNLSSLEVNKAGKTLGIAENNSYFRRGVVGDWVNHLTPEMAHQLDDITEIKLRGSGLTI